MTRRIQALLSAVLLNGALLLLGLPLTQYVAMAALLVRLHDSSCVSGIASRLSPWFMVVRLTEKWQSIAAAFIVLLAATYLAKRLGFSRTKNARAPQRRCVGRKRGIQQNALGRSLGGFSTKVHALVDAKGRPLHVTLTPGQRHEMIAAPELLDYARGEALIGDAGYDSNEFRAELKARGIKAVICSHSARKRKIPRDRALYRTRYLVEVFFHNLKRFRGIATRVDKTKASYLALVHVACICLWLK